jgi:hypothetical protein
MLKDDFDELQIGDWCFVNGETHIGIRLGAGENDHCILPVQNKSKPREIVGTHWEWNGSREAPSLTPSILHWGNGRNQPATWHGYLTDGKLVVV